MGVLKSGYFTEAEMIAENLITTLARDIRENGLLHEYYNPETGRSSINPGFMNWNGLAALMVPELMAYKGENNEA
jgi:putative isomerase